MRALTIDDLLDARSLASQQAVTIAPDGRHVAYVAQREGDRRVDAATAPTAVPQPAVGSRLRVVAVDGGATHEVVPPGLTAWGPCWSPDGRRLAFYGAEREAGPVRLWVWDTGRASARPVSDTALAGRAFGHGHPAWSADGRRACVALSGEAAAEGAAPADFLELTSPLGSRSQPSAVGGGGGVLAMIDIGTGSSDVLTEPGQLAYAGYPSPTSDDVLWEALAFGAQRGFWASATVHLRRSGGEDVVIGRRDLETAPPHPARWSPDGARFAYVADGRVVVADAAGVGTPSRRMLQPGAPAQRGFILWEADGGAVVTWDGERPWRVPVDGRPPTAIEVAGRTIRGILHDHVHGWLPPGDLVLFTLDPATGRQGLWSLAGGALVEEDADYLGGRFEPLTSFQADVTRSGGRFVYAIQRGRLPGEEIWVGERGGTARRPLVDLNRRPGGIIDCAVGSWRSYAFRVPGAQDTLGARILLPPGWAPGHPCATVVSIYPGARPSRDPHRFDRGPIIFHSLLAAKGYAVIEPDVPYDPRSPDPPALAAARAVLPAVDEAVRLGYCDPERLAVEGHSYGGYAVLTLLAQTDRFRAAIASAAVSDLVSFYGAMGSDPWNGMVPQRWVTWAESGQGGMGAPPWSAPDRYVANSPIFMADRIATPLLLIAGELDGVPWLQAGEMFTAMDRLGRDCTLLVCRAETHVPRFWSEPHRRELTARVLAWLERRVSPDWTV